MMYYAKDNKLFCTGTVIQEDGFFQITKEEYEVRLKSAVDTREKGTSVNDLVQED